VKVFLRDQRPHLAAHLPAFRQQPLSYSDASRFRDRRVDVPIPWPSPVPALDTLNFDFLFDYNVFPENILVFAADWMGQGRGLGPGDVIVQQAFLPPWRLSVKCVFAVRILETYRLPDRVGFRYGTLAGHAEQGESEFYFERYGAALRAVIHTQSRPGLLASRLAAPFFTYPYQAYCARQGVLRMRAGFLGANLF
jgi:hypothetical protein